MGEAVWWRRPVSHRSTHPHISDSGRKYRFAVSLFFLCTTEGGRRGCAQAMTSVQWCFTISHISQSHSYLFCGLIHKINNIAKRQNVISIKYFIIQLCVYLYFVLLSELEHFNLGKPPKFFFRNIF